MCFEMFLADLDVVMKVFLESTLTACPLFDFIYGGRRCIPLLATCHIELESSLVASRGYTGGVDYV